jgi:hypothetical protein
LSNLVQIIDAALASAAIRSGQHLACRPGCTQCCHGVFAISHQDAARLRTGLDLLTQTDPARAQRVRDRVATAIARIAPTFPGNPIRAYWEKAMRLFPGLHFTLEAAYIGANSMVICYTNQAARRCGEVLFFNDAGKCFRSAAHHA